MDCQDTLTDVFNGLSACRRKERLSAPEQRHLEQCLFDAISSGQDQETATGSLLRPTLAELLDRPNLVNLDFETWCSPRMQIVQQQIQSAAPSSEHTMQSDLRTDEDPAMRPNEPDQPNQPNQPNQPDQPSQSSKRAARKERTAQAHALEQRIEAELTGPADAAFAQQEYAQAVLLYTQAIQAHLALSLCELQYNDLVLHCLYRRAQCSIAEHDHDQAIMDASRVAHAWGQDDVRPLFLRAIALVRGSLYDCAVGELRALLNSMPDAKHVDGSTWAECDTKAVQYHFRTAEVQRLYTRARVLAWKPLRRRIMDAPEPLVFDLSALPGPLLAHVAAFLDATNLLRLECTCVSVRSLLQARAPSFWSRLASEATLGFNHGRFLAQFEASVQKRIAELKRKARCENLQETTQEIARLRELTAQGDERRSWSTFSADVYQRLARHYQVPSVAACKSLVKAHRDFMARQLGAMPTQRRCVYCRGDFWPSARQLCPGNWTHGEVQFRVATGLYYCCCRVRVDEAHYCAHTYYLKAPIPYVSGCMQGPHSDAAHHPFPLPFHAPWLTALDRHSDECKQCARQGGGSCAAWYKQTLERIAHGVRTRAGPQMEQFTPPSAPRRPITSKPVRRKRPFHFR